MSPRSAVITVPSNEKLFLFNIFNQKQKEILSVRAYFKFFSIHIVDFEKPHVCSKAHFWIKICRVSKLNVITIPWSCRNISHVSPCFLIFLQQLLCIYLKYNILRLGIAIWSLKLLNMSQFVITVPGHYRPMHLFKGRDGNDQAGTVITIANNLMFIIKICYAHVSSIQWIALLCQLNYFNYYLTYLT